MSTKTIQTRRQIIKTQNYFDTSVEFMIYNILKSETTMTLGLSLLMITLTVLLFTVNLQMTVLVICSVLLVDLFTLAVAHFWGLTFNHMLAMNLTFALGISVDFSVHIVHMYL